jgi:hypothetical protein
MTNYLFGVSNGTKLSEEVLGSESVNVIEVKKSDAEKIRELAQYKKPILFHLQYGPDGNFLNPCSPHFQQSVKGWLDEVVDSVKEASSEELPYISIHFGWSCSHFKTDPVTFRATHDTDAPGFENYNRFEDMLARFRNNAAFLKNKYNIPIICENLKFHPTCVYNYVTEPHSITRATNHDSIGGFLFDAAHALVAAHNLYEPPLLKHNDAVLETYLHRLPLDKILEIHVSGVGKTEEGFFTDSHNELEKASKELALLNLVVPWIGAETVPVILEYDRQPAQILAQLELVRKTLEKP